MGGNQFDIADVPWQVSIQNEQGNYHFCGGSIINETWILTAKHCLDPDDDEPYSIRAGSTYKFGRGQFIRVASSIPHPHCRCFGHIFQWNYYFRRFSYSRNRKRVNNCI